MDKNTMNWEGADSTGGRVDAVNRFNINTTKVYYGGETDRVQNQEIIQKKKPNGQ